MNRNQLRTEIDEITRVFRSAKYCEQDFKYLHSQQLLNPSVYYEFFYFVNRIFHSTSIAMILGLSMLFDKREKYSFLKLKNRILDNYGKSELCGYIQKDEVKNFFQTLDSERVVELLKKIKITRDEYYAHLDCKRTDFDLIQINSNETTELILIGEQILKSLELHYFDTDVDYNLTSEVLGHNIFERLFEWETYRGKFGILENS